MTLILMVWLLSEVAIYGQTVNSSAPVGAKNV